jgi:hypothetical protein
VILVDLGELRVSPRVTDAMAAGFDSAPFLFEHKRGSAGNLQSSEAIFAHITDVCRGLAVRSVHETQHGALHILTTPDRDSTTLCFANEIGR